MNHLSRGETKLTLDGIKAGSIFPSHLDDPISVGEREQFGGVFCHLKILFTSLLKQLGDPEPRPATPPCCRTAFGPIP